MVWYSHLLEYSAVYCGPHSQRLFGIVNKAEIDVFLELSCFFNDPEDVGNLKDSEHCAFLTIKQNLISTLLPIKKSFLHIYFNYSAERRKTDAFDLWCWRRLL